MWVLGLAFGCQQKIGFEIKTTLGFAAEGKDLIPTFNKSMVIYRFKQYSDDSYIGLTTRQLKKRVKEHIPACINKFLNLAEKDKEKNSN